MNKTIFRLLKVTTVSALIGILFSYGVAKFMGYKMKEESFSYLIHSNYLNELHDTYILCGGLISANPTKENIETCKYIDSKLQTLVTKVENDYPYINFYKNYIE